MIGICGAHRTGKTTLAKAFSEKTGIPFVQTKASGVFAEMGLDPKADYPLAQRIEVQKRILEACAKQYRSVDSGIFVTDRTPVDMVAYTFADVQRGNMTPELTAQVNGYVADCVAVNNAVFSLLMVVQPGIELVEEEGKAPANVAYIEHINSLVMGIAVSEMIESAHYYIPRGMVELDRRVEAMRFAIQKTNERFELHKQALMKMGEPMVFH